MIDLHCDALSRNTEKQEKLLSNSGQWDIWRARAAGEKLQVLAFFTEPQEPDTDWKALGRQAAYLRGQLEDELVGARAAVIRSAEELRQCFQQEKLGLLLHLEGGDALGKKLDRLDTLCEWGVKSLALTWNYRNALADGAWADDADTGLTEYGRKLITLMNERGMLLDLAHASRKTFFQALDRAAKPAYVSHANVDRLCRHPRNLTDGQIRAVAEQGGVIGLTYYRAFLRPDHAGLSHLVDHMSYVADLAGCEVLALGSDFDGADDMVFPDVVAVMDLPEAMRQRGFHELEINQILEGNARRYLEENL